MTANTLVVFYSRSNATRTIANFIKEFTNADVLDLQPTNPYPNGYFAAVKQAKKEIDDNYLPPLTNAMPDLSKYSTIFLGTPCWYGTFAPPLKTFITQNDLSGKTIIVFETHGGSGMANVEKDIQTLLPHSLFKKGLSIYGRFLSWDRSKVGKWLEEIEVISKDTNTEL